MITTAPIDVYRRAIERAVQLLGNEGRLARYLRVPANRLHAWRSGAENPPPGIFLNCVDLILDDERASTTQLYLPHGSGPGGVRR
jgi:hypothetical protein